MIKVLINGVACPTVQDDRILVNKRILDIENPDQKTADWTQGFLIQNTAKVSILFGQIFAVNLNIQNTSVTNFNPDFNPNLKAKCVIMNENTIVFSGYCQMNDIIITKDKLIRYQITAYANIGGFFNEIRTKELSDLDFSAYNHEWNYTNVTNSWTPTLGTGYVYPMIDWGLTTDLNQWSTEYFRPAVFVKDIVDKIFTAAGWSYSSAFFNSTRFKSLIVPYSAEALYLDNEEITNRSFLASASGSTISKNVNNKPTNLTDYIVFNQTSGTVSGLTLFNTSTNAYNGSTGVFTCAVKGVYTAAIDWTMRMTYSSPYTALTGSCDAVLILNRGGNISRRDEIRLDFVFTGGATTSDDVTHKFTTIPFDAQVGDTYAWIFTECKIYNNAAPFGLQYTTMTAEIDTGGFMAWNCQAQVTLGSILDMNSLLPEKIRQTDFIMGLAKMFNLYFDQTDDRVLLIEPREDYYTSDVVDWTTKIDIGQDVIYTPMGMNNQRRYDFTYEDDGDFFNEKYKKSYQRTYGNYFKDVVNDFLTEVKEIKPIFAATPLTNSVTGSNNKILSNIQFANEDGTDVKQGQTKLRILYWGGLTPCNDYTIKESLLSTTGTTHNSYPYAGHLDNPYTPTFDLSYGTPIAIYYDKSIGSLTYTDANLYSTYWYQTIEELTNKDSKVLEAFFRLNVNDFINLDFRKQYFIREAYYRLIEVNQYDVSGTALVNCKLLKIDKETSYTTSVKSLKGGNGDFDSGLPLPTKFIATVKDGRGQRIDNKYEGNTGYISATNTVNRGSNNNLPNAAQDSYVFGSSNVTLYQHKTFVHNSDDANVRYTGAMINSVYLEQKAELTLDEDTVKGIDNSNPFVVLTQLESNEYYQINKFMLEMGSGTAYENLVGTNDMQLIVNGNVTASIAQADWLGATSGTFAIGTITPQYEFSYPVEIQITGALKPIGDATIRIVIYYNIITL